MGMRDVEVAVEEGEDGTEDTVEWGGEPAVDEQADRTNTEARTLTLTSNQRDLVGLRASRCGRTVFGDMCIAEISNHATPLSLA